MDMTHYMGLIAENQPWNLLFYMAIPVVLAETLVVGHVAMVFGMVNPSIIKGGGMKMSH